ncbi:hypothetical protein JCM3765_007556 [Sporobolomyces pararoseus]
MSTLIRKLEEYGFKRVSEEKLFQDERENFHVFIDYSGAFVPFDSRAVKFMRPERTRGQLSSEDPSPTGSIIDHGEAAETTPSKQQTTPINRRSQIGLDSSTSRSEIRRRLEEHQQALLPAQQTAPLIDPRLPLPPIPYFPSTTRYRDELYDSTSTSPSTRTPALSRSTSSDCSLSPFPQFSSGSSPWTPWIHEFESSTFPGLNILEEPPLVATTEHKLPPSQPWSSLPNLQPQFPPLPSLPVPPPTFATLEIPHPPIAPHLSYQTAPRQLGGSFVDPGKSAISSLHPLNQSVSVPPVYNTTSPLFNSFGLFAPLPSDQQYHNSFQVLESTEVPTYYSNERQATYVPLDTTKQFDSKPGGGSDSQHTRSSQNSHNLLRPSPVRSSPLRPHPYDSNSRTIHSKRDSLNHLSIRRLELLASSTSPSSTLSRSTKHHLDSSIQTQCSKSPVSTGTSHPTTRRSSNASLERILNPSNSSHFETLRSSTDLPTLPHPSLSNSLFPHFPSETRSSSTLPPSLSTHKKTIPTSSTMEQQGNEAAPRSFGTLSDLLNSRRPVLLPNKGVE